MIEADFVRQVLTYYHELGAVVFKHNDRHTVGIPDISVTWNNNTAWLEAKATQAGESPVKRVSYDQLQLRTMQKLARYGRAIYIICDQGHLTVWHPAFLVDRIVKKKDLRWDGSEYTKAVEPFDVTRLIYDCVTGGWSEPLWFPAYDLEILRTLVEV